MPDTGNNRSEGSELQQFENYSSLKNVCFQYKPYASKIPGASHYFYREFTSYTNNVQGILIASRRRHEKTICIHLFKKALLPGHRGGLKEHRHRESIYSLPLCKFLCLFLPGQMQPSHTEEEAS